MCEITYGFCNGEKRLDGYVREVAMDDGGYRIFCEAKFRYDGERSVTEWWDNSVYRGERSVVWG